MKWYRKSAEQGVGIAQYIAQYSLGLCYEKGTGVPQSHEEAVKWYRKAAEKDFCAAQYSLGLCYEKGTGVPQNNEEAAKWYRKAAEQIPKAKDALKRLTGE